MYTFLRKKLWLHPVATKSFYDKPLLKPLFKLVKAIPVEVFDRDQGTEEDAEKMMQQLAKALKHGKHVLLYPQGGLARQGYQSIIGKKAAFYAVQRAPKGTKYITVKIR
jgi:1-acyl-sn-glycerol-3-phosphate acyltransferase